MNLFLSFPLALALTLPAAANAGSYVDVCAYREQSSYVDTLDRLAIGSSITTVAAGIPVVVEMTAAGLAVISAPVSVPVMLGATTAAVLFRSLNTYCKGSESSFQEKMTDMFCGLFDDCAEYSPF